MTIRTFALGVLLILFAGSILIGALLGAAVLQPMTIEKFSSPDLNRDDDRDFERELACLSGGGGWFVNRYEDAITGETRFRDFTRQRRPFVCLMPHQADPAAP